MDFYSFITLLAALIAIGASVISPMLTAKYTQQGAYKLKSTELFFDQKVEAYKNFLDIAITYADDPYKPNLTNALAHASMFSNRDTQLILADYAALVIQSTTQKISLYDLGNAQYKAMSAMKTELEEYKPQ